MKELLTAVREARRMDVPALLSELDRAGRTSALAELKALRKEARSWPWEKQDKIRKALLVAGSRLSHGSCGLRRLDRRPGPAELDTASLPDAPRCSRGP